MNFLPENGWILAESGWSSAKNSACSATLAEKGLSVARNWGWIWLKMFYLKFQPFSAKPQPPPTNFSHFQGENGWRRLNFGWKRLKLAHFGQNAAVCQPLSGHVQALWLKKAASAWKWMKWLSTAEFWLKMAAYWPKFSRNSTILSQLQPFSAYSQPTSAIFRAENGWILAENGWASAKIWPFSATFRHSMGKRFAHQRFADSRESVRANRFAKQSPFLKRLARFTRIASSLRFALKFAWFKLASKKIRNENRFARIGPLSSGRPQPFSASVPENGWIWLSMAECLAVRRRMSLVDNCEWGCGWLQKGSTTQPRRTAILNQTLFGLVVLFVWRLRLPTFTF